MYRTRLAFVAAIGAVGLAAAATALAVTAPFPKKISLPRGFQPEGIATSGRTFFVGSIPTGAIYRGDLGTGTGSVLVRPRAGRSAIGLAVRGRLLFVAGGSTGRAYVYDTRTGKELGAYRLASGETFVNDVVATRTAAWFTDSVNPILYRVPIRPDGSPGVQRDVRRVRLRGDIQYVDGFNANGIDATPDGGTLVIVQSNTGQLFAVNPTNGRTRRIDLGGQDVSNGDGLLLDGTTLFVVQNRQNTIAVIRLRGGLGSGSVVARLTDPDLDVPTTIADFGRRLYAVNARFGTAATADTEYHVVQLRKPPAK